MAAAAKAFIGQAAPAGYIPGVGRGATGFTTRSDIGPAREASDAPDERHWRHAGDKKKEGEDDNENLNDSNYDEFAGYSGSLFSGGAYDEEDREADLVYDAIDRRMDERRQDNRIKREKEELERFRKERPKIQQQFVDLKRDLAKVSAEEWDNLPEVADIGKKVKKQRTERFTPMPDSFLNSALASRGQVSELDARQQKFGGLATPMSGTQTLMPSFKGDLDLKEIGRARTSMMGVRLDQASDSVTGQTVVDPKGYLTDLNSLTPKSASDIGDVKKGRLLLQSVRQTNPKHAPGWIASARLEETVGRIQIARNLIVQGTQMCPTNEDIWLEAARLLPPDQAQAIVAEGVKHIATSVKIWMRAAELEQDVQAKKRVLRQALEAVPDSVRLWKAAVDLEEAADARLLLGRAVECCPTSVDLWLALAHLETYDNAKQVLNRARKAIPGERSVWITAARLEESMGKKENVETIVQTAVKSLKANMVEINRPLWLEDAERCDKSGSPLTAQAIVRTVVGVGIEDQDRLETWMHDCEAMVEHGAYNCARAVYAHALTLFPSDENLWLKAAFFEREHGTSASLIEHLKQAVARCPRAEVLWLMRAKALWLANQAEEAKKVLAQAFTCNDNSEEIWLAAIKLESETGFDDNARALLKRAREKAGTARIWMKSVRFEWVTGNLATAQSLLDSALELHPQHAKLWMMKGQMLQQEKRTDEARIAFANGLKQCPTSIPLWRLAAELEANGGQATRARALLENARKRNPKSPELWLAAVRVERAHASEQAAKALMAKALQDCPNSGLLWAEAVFMEAPVQRRARSMDALKHCENDPLVLLAVARLFLTERKTSKARSWFNRTVKLDPDLGDAWAAYYKFELQYGTEAQQEEVLQHCVTAEPHHGEIWQSVAKNPVNWKLNTKDILLLTARQLTM
eukprot:m.188305 g.188305  ORF g.188305 m.188305 type:complete len:922 (+) comp17534_c0_seq2:46-2811(+)